MAHKISGIVTSFKYTGELKNTQLLADFFFIPLRSSDENLRDYPIAPFRELNNKILRIIKDLSFHGKTAWIETDFFIEGTQHALTFENGVKTLGPLVSFHGIDPVESSSYMLSVGAINQTLEFLGVKRSINQDEFDLLRLGEWRSNNDFYL